jgi:hypothetical protein
MIAQEFQNSHIADDIVNNAITPSIVAANLLGDVTILLV